jgi:hypothetical protein
MYFRFYFHLLFFAVDSAVIPELAKFNLRQGDEGFLNERLETDIDMLRPA